MSTKSFGTKFILLIVSLLIGMIVSNLALLGLLMSTDMEMSDIMDKSNFLSQNSGGTTLFLGIGVSHLILFTGSAFLFWKLASKLNFKEYFNMALMPKMEFLMLFIFLLFAAYPLIGASGMLSEYIQFPEWMKSIDSEYFEAMNAILSGDTIGKLLLNILIIAILPAIGEELIFRGIVQKELHNVVSNPHIVILITSVIFSGIHFQAEGFLPKLLISFVLCYSYYWTKNLWYPIILHFVNNSSMTLALYFGSEEMQKLEKMETPDFPWGGVAISLFLCTVIVYRILAMLKNDNELQKGQLANE